MKLGGDLAEFGKKRSTDHDFPPPFMWAENKNLNRTKNSTNTQQDSFRTP